MNSCVRIIVTALFVCLFVGAGVSKGCGLPEWKELAGGVVDRLPRKPGPPLGSRAAAYRQGRPAPPDPNALLGWKRAVLEEMINQGQPAVAMRYARSAPDVDVPSLVRECLYAKEIVLSETILQI